jgi:hypothetical protein
MVGVVGEVMTDLFEFTFMFTVTDGKSNDRRDGSSSKNECNGKLDLNHFF